MPVIFLDIDGALTRKSLLGSTKHHSVEPDLLRRFQQLVQDTSALVVLASTWRHDAAGLAAAREYGIPFDDVLPDLRPRSRGDEIEAWLRTHPNAGRFAVIDDDDDGYGSMPLFQPDPREGLTPELADALCTYLRGETDLDVRRSVFVRAIQCVRDAVLGHRG